MSSTWARVTLRAGGWAVLLGVVGVLTAAFLVPRATGADSYTVLSSSMAPTLEPGSVVAVRPRHPDEIGVGTVVTYQIETGEPALATHRIVAQGIDKDGNHVFRTQGDANGAPDQRWIRAEQVRGEVWYAIPYVGYFSNLLPNNIRPFIVIATATTLLGYAAVMFAQAGRERMRTRHA